jgi:transposase
MEYLLDSLINITYIVPMYIETVPNRSSPPAILLRESTRKGRKVIKKTLANITDWPPAKVEALRRVLRNEACGGNPAESLQITASLPHGHVKAVLGVIRRLGLDSLIASRRSRQRDLVIAMIAARILFPASKLDTIVRWKQCTLADELAVGDADELELYQALDWLLGRQQAIEDKLAARHLKEGGSVLYDLSSSFYYGTHCPLARFGHDRDKKGLAIIVYGVLANPRGCPVATAVYAGNTSDPRTVADQAKTMKERFGLERAVLVGDRGCVTQAQINVLKEHPGLGWIGALRSTSIRTLLDQKLIQPSLFDQRNLAEIASPDFPGERLMACFNPLLAEQRRRKREELLAATEKLLENIVKEVGRRTKTPLSKPEIGLKVGRKLNHYKVGKHFRVSIGEGSFSYQRRTEAIEREKQMDGIYVVRTSEPAGRLSAADAVRGYKDLAHVERAFRCLKGVDLLVRPIYLRTEDHVKAHIFLCLLAYYVEWHMRRALAELLYAEEELDELRRKRDPVLPAETSESARAKKAEHVTEEGMRVRTWSSLIQSLSTLCRNTCRMKDDPQGPSFVVETDANDFQERALGLLECVQYHEAPN